MEVTYRPLKTADVARFEKYEGLHEHVTFSDEYN
jgi:hypothetical protein